MRLTLDFPEAVSGTKKAFADREFGPRAEIADQALQAIAVPAARRSDALLDSLVAGR